jgi:hypothetical protein
MLMAITMCKDRPEQILENLRKVSDYLVPYNFPLGEMELEDEIGALKRIEMTVDGYDVVVCFNKADYEDYYLETFQIFSRHSIYLPFHLVVKLACKMLGAAYLSFIEFYQDNRKVYCWSVCVDDNGKAIRSPHEDESVSKEYQGFAYKQMHPSQINLY